MFPGPSEEPENLTVLPSGAEKKKSGSVIGKFVFWYLTISLLLSGMGIAISGVCVFAGLIWFLSGIFLLVKHKVWSFAKLNMVALLAIFFGAAAAAGLT